MTAATVVKTTATVEKDMPRWHFSTAMQISTRSSTGCSALGRPAPAPSAPDRFASLFGAISPTEIKMHAPITQPHTTGYRLLHNPRLNKGTAFTEAERRKYGLEGLLPPAVTNIDLQIARRHNEIAALGDYLQKYLVLSDLQARNEIGRRLQPSSSGQGAAAHRHHRRQHSAETVHPRGDQGDGRDQRTANHLPLFEPDLALGMHRRGGLSVVGRQGGFRQR